MERKKNMAIDISTLLLVEATGDSEADSVPAITGDPGLSGGMDGGGDGDGDADGDADGDEDAASCSSEWSSCKSYNNHDVRDLDCGDVEACDGVDESDRWWWARETRNNERFKQRRWWEAEDPCVSEEEINSFDDDREINKKPSGIVSSEVHLSEVEKSRLFWEACLAS